MKKLFLLLGLVIGYVLGARAGRARYEQIKGAAQKAWQADQVQSGVRKVKEVVDDAIPAVVGGVNQLVNTSTEFANKIFKGGKSAEGAKAEDKSEKTAAPAPAVNKGAAAKPKNAAAKP